MSEDPLQDIQGHLASRCLGTEGMPECMWAGSPQDLPLDLIKIQEIIISYPSQG